MIAPDLADRLRARFAGGTIAQYLDFELETLDQDFCELSIEFDSRFDNGSGTVHGGVLAMLADTAVACALSTNFDGKMGFATSAMNIHFLKRAKTRVTAAARVIKKGAKVCVATVDVRDDHGDLVATVTADFVLTTSKLPGRAG